MEIVLNVIRKYQSKSLNLVPRANLTLEIKNSEIYGESILALAKASGTYSKFWVKLFYALLNDGQ